MDESTPVPIPQLLRAVADEGDRARQALANWGVVVSDGSRLEAAAALLREAAAEGQIDPRPEAVLPVLRALWVAADFADIATYLPASRVTSIRRELTTAVNGQLWPPAGSRQPLQLQTQHWIGAILTHAGLELEHATASASHAVRIPEFFIVNGLKRIGVEVKRPESRRRLPTMIQEAMTKFSAHDCFAAIVLELTDCIESESEPELVAQGNELMRVTHETVWDDARGDFRAGYGSLIYLGAVARGGWQVPAEDKSRLRLMGHAWHRGYARHANSLHGRRSQWLQEQANRAFMGVIARLAHLTSLP